MKYAITLLAALSLGGGACTKVHGGLGVSHSAGSVYVGDIETGIGGGVEVGASRETLGGELGVVATADLAGYSGSNDGDPILWGTAQVRYRRYLADPSASLRPFFALGGGAGVDRDTKFLVLEGFGELGLRYAVSSGLGLTLGLRERPAAFIGSGDPAVEPHNTVQLMAGLELSLGGN
jgi:hypothetical protein